MSLVPRLFLALFLAAVLGLSGCGSDSDSDSDEGRSDSSGDSGSSGGGADDDDSDSASDSDDDVFDVCGLLEPADLEAAFGSPWGEGEATHHEQTGGDQCLWGNTDPPPIKQFSIVVMREGHLSEGFEGAGVTVKSLFEDTKEYMTDAEDVDLGDDAYLSGSTIAVLDGDTSYEFSTVLGTSPEAVAGLRTLAEQVING